MLIPYSKQGQTQHPSDLKHYTLFKLLKSCTQELLPEIVMRAPTTNFTKIKYRSIALTLSKIGDVILSLTPHVALDTKTPQVSGEKFENMFELEGKSLQGCSSQEKQRIIDQKLLHFPQDGSFISATVLIQIYYLAYKIYAKAGVMVSASFQLRKILHVLRACTIIDPKANNEATLKFIEEAFVKKILEIASRNSNSTDKIQIDKFETYFGQGNRRPEPAISAHIFRHISNSPETKEALLFYADLGMKCWAFPKIDQNDPIKLLSKMIHPFDPYFKEQSLLSNPSGISSQFTRIMELSFQERCNHSLLQNCIAALLPNQHPFVNEKEKDLVSYWSQVGFGMYHTPETKNHTEVKKQRRQLIKDCVQKYGPKNKQVYCYFGELVVNSIHCLHQILSIVNISGISYLLSYSYLGHFHRKLAEWLKYYTLLHRLIEEGDLIIEGFSIKESLEELIGVDSLRSLHPISQFQMAAQNYRKALQLHAQGDAYYQRIQGMVYLEDDYNDNSFHYYAAVEKQQINSGVIQCYLDEIDALIDNSQLLDLDRYWYAKG